MIEIKNVSKKFGDKIIFDNINITIPDKSFLVLAGPSGCGKTTFLNIIGGLEKIDNGSILLNGMDITKKKNLRKCFTYQLGFLFQNFALMENKTVEDNLKIVQKRARTEKNIDEILEMLGIENKKKEKVYKLSGGEQQRVAIARLIYKQCSVILADEPTGSLDSKNTKSVLKILHDLNYEGKTVILVTHDENIINSERNVKFIGKDI